MLFIVDRAKCGVSVCVSSVMSVALPWVTEKILTLFSVSRAGAKTRPF
jgi:hypothetical protein